MSIYEGTDESVTIQKRDIDNSAKRLTNFFRNAIYSDFGNEIEESSSIFEFVNTLGNYKELRDSLVRVNAFILTNGTYKGEIPTSKDISGYKIYYRIVDINYLYQISEQSHAPIFIDFKEEGEQAIGTEKDDYASMEEALADLHVPKHQRPLYSELMNLYQETKNQSGFQNADSIQQQRMLHGLAAYYCQANNGGKFQE